jgi:hypothetical protein
MKKDVKMNLRKGVSETREEAELLGAYVKTHTLLKGREFVSSLLGRKQPCFSTTSDGALMIDPREIVAGPH